MDRSAPIGGPLLARPLGGVALNRVLDLDDVAPQSDRMAEAAGTNV